jgi:AbrB family looped-hinge helix DNA binding protein
MTATIDGAGRVVIPKALRDRAGLVAGTRVDFRFHDGAIEIAPVASELAWEQVGRVRYPVLAEPGLSTEAIVELIEAGRDERLEA